METAARAIYLVESLTTHGDHAVFLTGDEERRIAEGLGLTLCRFCKQHTHRPFAPGRSLCFPDGRCTFLRDRQCSIYETPVMSGEEDVSEGGV